MNPFEELQAPQAPALGGLLAGQQAPPPAQQAPAGPAPVTPEELSMRTQGWTGALQELVSQPHIALALMQMGTALTSGRGFGDSLAEGMGAVGRAQGMEEKLRQQRTVEQQNAQKVALDERQVAAQEMLQRAQAENYQRLARGGGAGGGGAGATEDPTAKGLAELQALGYSPEEAQKIYAAKKWGVKPVAPGGIDPADAAKALMEGSFPGDKDYEEGADYFRNALRGAPQAGQPAQAGAKPSATQAQPSAQQKRPVMTGQKQKTVNSPEEVAQRVMRKELQLGDDLFLPDGTYLGPVTEQTVAGAREWAKKQPNLGR